MAFIYEVNGQKVEFEKEPTDKDIDEAAAALGSSVVRQKSPEETVATMAAPAVTGAAYAVPTGAAQAGRAVASGVTPLVKEIAKSYLTKPLTAAADVGLMAMGAPPIVGPVTGSMDRMGAIREGMLEASKQVSTGAPTTSPVRGVPTTTTVAPYMDMLRSAPPAVQNQITDLYRNQGGNNAVKAWLNSAEGQAIAKSNPQFAANAARYIEATPGIMTQAGRMVKPLAVGAARVLGPAAMAMDVNQAFEFARQQDLGGQLAAGAGRRAPEAYRSLLNKNISGYQPTPQEAANLLASGDTRTINIYGGPDKLRELVRQQAAQRITGPIAPR